MIVQVSQILSQIVSAAIIIGALIYGVSIFLCRSKVNDVKDKLSTLSGIILFSAFMLFVSFTEPIAPETQELDIFSQETLTDISQFEADSKYSIENVYNVAKYAIATELIIGLIFVVCSFVRRDKHAKEYLIAWFTAATTIAICILTCLFSEWYHKY